MMGVETTTGAETKMEQGMGQQPRKIKDRVDAKMGW